MNTIIRFNNSKAINITATVQETVRFLKGTFHIENVADAIEFQGIKVVDRASTLVDDSVLGKNQIRNRLNELARYGWLKRLGGGWYVF